MEQEKAVGIDLGTTNSAVAFLDESGRSKMITNLEGDLLTPSVVLFEDTEVIVGKQAQTAASVSPERVAEWVKLDMGQELYSRPIRGEFLPPEVIQACILRKLKTDIAEQVGASSRVVITVPAYFDEPRRNATATAGEMAGLTVLDIVNEPTAAALAFGESLGYLSASASPTEEITVLVYDLGGGTFDVTLLRLAPGDIRTLATDGDVRLGGHDWDLRLVNHVAEAFKEAHGVDPREDPSSMNRLFSAVIEAKQTLSARSRATVRVEHAGHVFDVQVSRDAFDDMTADLLDRTSYTCRQLIADAGVAWQEIDQILLVGGSTRMPMVAGLLESLSGKTPVRSVNPDEAVARGAALYAGYLLATQEDDSGSADFEVTNVNSHSLGMAGVDPTTGRKTNKILIRKNTPLPFETTKEFITNVDGQRSIVIQVLEGENADPEACTAVGRTAIRHLPPGLSQGTPIEVTFEYGINGRLTVEAIVPGTASGVKLELERDSSLSGDRIAEWKEIVERAGAFDDFEEEASSYIMAEEANQVASAPTSLPESDEQPSPAPGPEETVDRRAPVEERDDSFELAAMDEIESENAKSEEKAAADETVNMPPDGFARMKVGAVTDDIDAGGSWDEPDDAYDGPTRDQLQVIQQNPKSKSLIPHWLIYIVGYLMSAVVGLGLGYVIISWLFPHVGLPEIPWLSGGS